jgi:hypothetical protein
MLFFWQCFINRSSGIHDMQQNPIQDLSFFEDIHEFEHLSGGIYTQVYGTAQTGYGVAFATVNSFASGQQTYTFGSTLTSIQNTSFSTTSYAQSVGTASAKSGNSFSSATNKYLSSSTYINYSFH